MCPTAKFPLAGREVIGHARPLDGRDVWPAAPSSPLPAGPALGIRTGGSGRDARAPGRSACRASSSNACASGINTRFAMALMLIDDHINLMGSNPLIAWFDPALGARFPDMTEVYSRRLRALATEVAATAGIAVEHGIYVAVHGPSYETPAEIRAFRVMGADAVGMSTAPETIVARQMGLEVLGISCISNPAAGVVDAPLNHEDVMAVTTPRARAVHPAPGGRGWPALTRSSRRPARRGRSRVHRIPALP